MATCPECDAEIEVDEDDSEELQIGDLLDCDECGSSLRVASLDPLEFDDADEDEDDDEVKDKVESDDASEDSDDDDDDDDADDGGEWDE